jgi:succinate dehydrogenase / fumarate reductase, iron-sulfur subunit
MKTYQISVQRFEPGCGEPFRQDYSFEADERAVLSILDGLEYIYQNLDPTLAFFHHAACRQAACGKCMLKANGKSVLACKQKLAEGGLLLEPFGKTVVKDLVAR